MKRRITLTYEIETAPGVAEILANQIDFLIHRGLSGTGISPVPIVRDGTFSIERLDDCPVYTAATEAHTKKIG